MPQKKTDPLLDRLFDGSHGEPSSTGTDARREDEARAELRDDVFNVLRTTGGASRPAEILDDATLAAYLDGALAEDERVALEARIARSAELSEQVELAATARAAALSGDLTMPAEFSAAFDAVPAPSQVGAREQARAQTGALGWLGGLLPGRRWAAVAMPALLAVIVAVAVVPDYSDREPSTEREMAAGARTAREAPADRMAKAKPAPAKPVRRAEAKPAPPASAAAAPKKPEDAEKRVAILSIRTHEFTPELRQAMLAVAQLQDRGFYHARTTTDTSTAAAPKAAERTRRRTKQRAAGAAPAIALKRSPTLVINAAIAPTCPGDPTACCARHKIDPRLAARLAGPPPYPKTFKVQRLSSGACLLSLP